MKRKSILKAHELEKIRESKQIPPGLADAFLGLTRTSMRDLEWYNDERWEMTVIEFLRLCVLYDLEPSQLVPSGKVKTDHLPPLPVDEKALSYLRSNLLSACSDFEAASDAVGWEAEALERWLSDFNEFGEMPMPALKDVCDYLQVDFAHFISIFFHLLSSHAKAEGESTKTV